MLNIVLYFRSCDTVIKKLLRKEFIFYSLSNCHVLCRGRAYHLIECPYKIWERERLFALSCYVLKLLRCFSMQLWYSEFFFQPLKHILEINMYLFNIGARVIIPNLTTIAQNATYKCVKKRHLWTVIQTQITETWHKNYFVFTVFIIFKPNSHTESV